MFKRCLIVAILAFVPAIAGRAQVIEQVLVNVNGDILSKGEFEQRQIAVLRTRPDLFDCDGFSMVLMERLPTSTF